ncbi:MAG TPA: subclass B3 metallo-beta-lactamase [Blastocatellia bacterium]|nr:subclass B3 metallo-beta-lactamase [Blastocatellia bacterium]
MKKILVTISTIALLLTALVRPAGSHSPQFDDVSKTWNQPIKPYRVIGNLYYVGAAEVSSFLITTPAGHILLDSGFAETVPQIKENVVRLGFKFEDVKILINSHAHFDHAGGLALLKEMTGAELAVSEPDAALLADGGKNDFQWGDRLTFKPVKADRLLRDNDRVELGGVEMIARLTPGHTKGCTTWTMKVKENGKQYDVVIVGSASVPGYKLVNNAKYPNIVEDYEQTFRVLKSLSCDVFLAPHGSFFDMKEKLQKLDSGAKRNPFIHPQGLRRYIKQAEKTFRETLEKQRQTQSPGEGKPPKGA